MAEAILAFGVAANIVGFIDFTAKVIASGKSKYGALSDLNLIKNVNNDLRSTLRNLEKSIQEQQVTNPTENQRELLSLAGQCSLVATDLFTVLDSLEVQETKVYESWKVQEDEPTSLWGSWRKTKTQHLLVKWPNFRSALKAVWKEDEVKALEHRLDMFRQQLVLRILVTLRWVLFSFFAGYLVTQFLN